jgi:hypothetical protein
MKDFGAAIRIPGSQLQAQVSFLTTSCYGGGWTQSPHLNITAFTAAPRDGMSLSWPMSGSQSARYCGSIYATAVTTALIKMSIEDINMEEEEESQTYASLTEIIHHTLVKEVDTRQMNHALSFSAQDDLWETEWQIRQGFPLAEYESRWNVLRSVPAAAASGPSQSGSIKLSSGIFTHDQAKNAVMVKAVTYMNSFPGINEGGENTMLHGRIFRLFNGTYDSELDKLELAIEYRLNHMHLATRYGELFQNYLEKAGKSRVDLKPCHETDIQGFRTSLSRPERQKFAQIWDIALPSLLFEEPSNEWDGLPYSKGHSYLVMAIYKAGLSRSETETILEALKSHQSES